MSTMLQSEQETCFLSQQKQASQIEYVLNHNELHSFAIQIARGMQHLEKYQITHR